MCSAVRAVTVMHGSKSMLSRTRRYCLVVSSFKPQPSIWKEVMKLVDGKDHDKFVIIHSVKCWSAFCNQWFHSNAIIDQSKFWWQFLASLKKLWEIDWYWTWLNLLVHRCGHTLMLVWVIRPGSHHCSWAVSHIQIGSEKALAYCVNYCV